MYRNKYNYISVTSLSHELKLCCYIKLNALHHCCNRQTGTNRGLSMTNQDDKAYMVNSSEIWGKSRNLIRWMIKQFILQAWGGKTSMPLSGPHSPERCDTFRCVRLSHSGGWCSAGMTGMSPTEFQMRGWSQVWCHAVVRCLRCPFKEV